MPIVNLHIGAGKCGSSLIQRLLTDADGRMALDQECLPHLSNVLMSNTPCLDFDDYHYQQTLNMIRGDTPEKDCVFSCENLFGIDSHKEPCYWESIKVIHYLFDHFDKVRLLLYVRRQDNWIEAMYAQDVKRQEIRDFDVYFATMAFKHFDWFRVAEAYGKDFELTVLPFEGTVLKTGGIENFVYGFYKWLGADVEIENLPIVNPSLSEGGMKVQMMANKSLPEAEAYTLSQWLERHAAKSPQEPFNIMTDKDRAAILDRYRESNAKLFEKWCPDFDPSFYTG